MPGAGAGRSAAIAWLSAGRAVSRESGTIKTNVTSERAMAPNENRTTVFPLSARLGHSALLF